MYSPSITFAQILHNLFFSFIKNNFTFIAKTEQELAEGLAVDENGNEVTSGNESVDVMIEQQEDESSFATIMKIALMVLGGIVLCGGIAAVVLSSKKKKN